MSNIRIDFRRVVVQSNADKPVEYGSIERLKHVMSQSEVLLERYSDGNWRKERKGTPESIYRLLEEKLQKSASPGSEFRIVCVFKVKVSQTKIRTTKVVFVAAKITPTESRSFEVRSFRTGTDLLKGSYFYGDVEKMGSLW